MEFDPRVLKFAPWSISKADLGKQCGLKFQWKYVEKKKEQVSVRSEGRVGSAAHKAMELVLKGSDMQNAFTVASVDNKLTTKEIDDLMTFNGSITAFLQRIAKFKAKAPAIDTLVEHQFGLTRELKPSTFFGKDVFFRGVYDFGLRLENRDLVIIDHKSGAPSDDMSKYTNQLNSYALAGRQLFPEIKGVQSALHYLQDGSLVWGTYITTTEIDERLAAWLMTYLNESVEGIDGKPRPGWYCGFCGYASQCPAQKDNK
jgi:ATP-dependent exoDNAse (exonuclease V) beta subunit